MTAVELVVRGVRLADGRGPVDLRIGGGRVVDQRPTGGSEVLPAGVGSVDGTGRVVIPAEYRKALKFRDTRAVKAQAIGGT